MLESSFFLFYLLFGSFPFFLLLLVLIMKLFEIDKGIAGRTQGDPVPYAAIGYLYFDNLSAYRNSFRPHAEKIRNDIPNYTNIQPVIQISEVVR